MSIIQTGRFFAGNLPTVFKFYNGCFLRMSSSSFNRGLEGKVAIITGSTEGIGFSIAKRLAQEGAHVVVSSRRQENVDKAVDKLKSEGLKHSSGIVCHVGKKEDREALIQHALDHEGGIDIFVANAGINPYIGPTLNVTEQIWDKVFDVNLKSVFLMTQQVIPHLRKRGGGSIVYISTLMGLLPQKLFAPYSISKTALLSMTKVFSNEFGPENIRVNCVAPGLIKTRMGEVLWNTEAKIKSLKEKSALGRVGNPDEMAGPVAFLCSNDASYITGEVISATGGFMSRM